MPYSVKIGSQSGNAPSDRRGGSNTGNGPTSKSNPVLIVTVVAVIGIVALAIWWFAGSSGGSSQPKAMTFPEGTKGPPIPGPPGDGAGVSGTMPGDGMGTSGRARLGPAERGSMPGGGPPIPGPPGGAR